MRLIFTCLVLLVLNVFAIRTGMDVLRAPMSFSEPAALTPVPEPPTPMPTDVPTATPVPTDVPTPTPTAAIPHRPTAIPTATPTLEPRPEEPIEMADPALTKQANVQDARVGDVIEFTLTVSNRGSSPARDVVVTDPLPGFLMVLNATTTRGIISVSGNTVTIAIGTLPAGETVVIRIVTQVVSGALPPDNRNIAYLSTTSNGNITTNDVDSTTVTIQESEQPSATPTPESTPSATPPVTEPPAATPEPIPPSSPAPAGGSPASTGGAAETTTQRMLPSTGADDNVLMITLYVLSLILINLVLGLTLVYIAISRRFSV